MPALVPLSFPLNNIAHRNYIQQRLETNNKMGLSEKSDELSRDVIELPSEVSSPSWTPEAERKLVRKIDLCLLPMLWVMNLLSWMDRAK